ncbi:hypothetical protein PVAND_001297 [Polypedilum vanderplanki]|uniref:C2H2-type domain-containing protein n=1 Tax=Polypedilum vanderplanki TaxID=319348 RepID=A0A9J6BNU5_POLVA|nr:hypothetical protein PVAND_001297 [Polypedilum vanderplanki]
MENVLTCECGKTFPESNSYRKHQETHINKNESTRCNFYGETFKSKRVRIRHEQTEHSSNYTSEEDIKNKEEKDNCAIDFVDDCV